MRKTHQDPITVRVAQNLKDFRKIFDLSQIKLGILIGVDPDTIRNWEACRRRPDMESLAKISDLFELSEYFGIEDGWLWFFQQHSKPARGLRIVPPRPGQTGRIVTKQPVKSGKADEILSRIRKLLEDQGGEDLTSVWERELLNSLQVA